MSKMYDVAEVRDEGTYYRVLYVTKNDLSYLIPGKKFIPLSYMAAKRAKESVDKGDEVLIPKDLTGPEVIPSNLIINPVSEDEAIRSSAVARIHQRVNGGIMALSALSFYEFFCLHAELAEDGFFITNKNREEQYLKIVKSRDEEMIKKLERYLELKDEIDSVSLVYRKYKEAAEAINNAKIEDVEDIEEKFLKSTYV